MTALTRFRIIIFAVMVLGAFANFAQNEWGNDLIVICELIVAVSFFGEAISYLVPTMMRKGRAMANIIEVSLGMLPAIVLTVVFHTRTETAIDTTGSFVSFFLLFYLLSVVITERIYAFVKKHDREYMRRFIENYFLSAIFVSAVMNNLFLQGASIVMFSSFIGLFFVYFISTVKFFWHNFKNGKQIIPLLCLGSVAAILMGVGMVFKRQHLPGATIVLYTGLALSILFLLSLVKRKFTYNGEPITVTGSLKLIHTHIVFIFFLVFFFSCYLVLQSNDMAPRFYSQHYPAAIYKMDRKGGLDASKKASELANAYDAFIERSDKNGFLK